MEIKKNIKDSLFTSMFGEKRYTLQLYKALHPEDKTELTEKDISLLTIENVLVNDIYNDLGFLIKDRLIVLVEAQSTWSTNIIIRMFLYLAKTYQEYISSDNIMRAKLYSSSKIRLPEPEMYVIYTGARDGNSDILSLKDLYFPKIDSIDLKAKVIFADDKNENIIGEYLAFCTILHEQLEKYKSDKKKAVQETIRICIDQGNLAEYLESHKKEVENIMITLFSQEELTESYGALKAQEGRQEGETDFGKLVKCLVKDGRMDALDRATEDPLYRQKLYEEYGIR